MALAPFAAHRLVASHDGKVAAHAGPVLHVQASSGSCYGMFASPANKKSSNFWISKAGVLDAVRRHERRCTGAVRG